MKVKENTLQETYETNKTERDIYENRGKESARLTLTYLAPDSDAETSGISTQHGWEGIGAEAVNSFVSKLALTFFPKNRSFFKATGGPSLQRQAMELGMPLQLLKNLYAQVEKNAMLLHETKDLRRQEIEILMRSVVQGNAMHIFNKDGTSKVIQLKNYIVKRDQNDVKTLMMTLEESTFSTLREEIQKSIRASNPQKKYTEDQKLKLYTMARLKGDFYEVSQEIDQVAIKTTGGKTVQRIPKDKLLWYPQEWKRLHGENYGRGLVEDHIGDFYVINVLSEAIAKGMIIMSDVKYLAKPGAILDIDHFISSPTGEILTGEPDDLVAMQLERFADFEKISDVLERYERRIGRVFMMSTATRRDDERVTKFEIAMDANELSATHAGSYSTFAVTWQKPMAHWLISLLDPVLDDKAINIEVVTGIDSLGRADELNKIGQFSDVLSLPNNWPESMQSRVKWNEFSDTVGNALSLETSWIKSDEEVEQEQAQAAAQQQQQVMAEGTARAIPGAVTETIKQQG